MDETDIAGHPRIRFGIVDVGAHEAESFDDCNNNDVPDWIDAAGTSGDCNGNDVPDECEDCNDNGAADECDLADGTSYDCSGNGVPDECDVESWMIIDSQPPDGAVDARQPVSPDGSTKYGWHSAALTFDGDVSVLTAADFAVTQEGGIGPAPVVRLVSVESANAVRVILADSIEPGAWTTISYNCNSSHVRFGYLPGDVDGNEVSDSADVSVLIDVLNSTTERPLWSTDINRDGRITAQDLLREVDLLNGTGVFDVWMGQSLP
jgi:hypothetical protein